MPPNIISSTAGKVAAAGAVGAAGVEAATGALTRAMANAPAAAQGALTRAQETIRAMLDGAAQAFGGKAAVVAPDVIDAAHHLPEVMP